MQCSVINMLDSAVHCWWLLKPPRKWKMQSVRKCHKRTLHEARSACLEPHIQHEDTSNQRLHSSAFKYNSWRHDTRHIDVHVSDRAPNSRFTHFIPYFERRSESRQETSTVVCSYATSASFHATFAHDSFFIFCSNKHVCLHKTCKQFKLKFRNGLQTYLSSPQRKFRIHLRVTYTQS